MEKLVIMDYVTHRIHIYDIYDDVMIDDLYIQDVLGYSLDNIEWMKGYTGTEHYSVMNNKCLNHLDYQEIKEIVA